MISFFKALLYILIAAFAAWFAMANPDETALIFSPLHDPVSVPVYIVGLGGLGIGFIFGCLVVWLNSISLYFDKRAGKKEIKKLEKRLAKIQKQTGLELPATPKTEGFDPYEYEQD